MQCILQKSREFHSVQTLAQTLSFTQKELGDSNNARKEREPDANINVALFKERKETGYFLPQSKYVSLPP